MKATEILSKAKELLSIETEVKLAQATLENGTVIEAEEMAEGKEVFIVTEDEKVALPVGEYTLEDGQALIVEEEGIIASKEEMSAEELAEEAVEDIVEEVKEELSEVEKITHNPEASAKKELNLFAQKRASSTLDRVLGKFGNFNK